MPDLGLLLPAAILLLLFIVLPLLMAGYYSMTNRYLLDRPVPIRFVWFQNYGRVLSDPAFWQAFRNTALFAALVVPVQCGLALALALVLNLQIPFRAVFRSIFFLPTITSMVVVCVIWASIYQYPSGVLNAALAFFSAGTLGPHDWLGDAWLAMPALVLMSAWQGAGFQMLIFVAGLQNISPQLYEAAKMDGAGPWQRFRHVTLPGLRPVTILVTLTTAIQSFKLFTQVNILTQGGPVGTTNTLVRYMYHSGVVQGKVYYGSTVAILYFVIILVFSLLQRRVANDY